MNIFERLQYKSLMHSIFLLLGGNLGNRLENLQKAARFIERRIGDIMAESAYYETAPWGKEDQPFFLNQVIKLNTSMPPLKLLDTILSIEEKLGRKREEHWGERTIDIDILLYGSEIIEMPQLTIPHKLLHERRFVLMPLNEIAADLIHPVMQKSMKKLLADLDDDLSVQKYKLN